MRFLSILLAGAFLSVAMVGCGGGDDGGGEPPVPGVDNSGADEAPAGMDPKGMQIDPIKGDDGKVIDPGGKEDVPKGESPIPKEVTGTVKPSDGAKADPPKKDGGDKKEGGDKKDGGDKKEG